MQKVKAKAISGFPEWLPQQRAVEQRWMDQIRSVYESYGYLPIETAAVEALEVLRAKGEIDKEIYVIKKLHEDASVKYGLHYDLTVPLARYVAQNYGDLDFPFRRYQMQKIWRGERPQKGRYREFYQCDIDVIDNNDLGIYFDFEVLFAGQEALKALDIPEVEIGVSNRKIYEGYLEALGASDTAPILRIIDKMDKIGEEGVTKMLLEMGLEADFIANSLKPAGISSFDLGFADAFAALGVTNEKASEGIEELKSVIMAVQNAGGGNVKADLSFVRGFDYYTGTIFEGKFKDNPEWGSVCAGGRYENLAGRFTKKALPGVGFSIGLSRIFGLMIDQGVVAEQVQASVDAIVFRTREDDLADVLKLSTTLRKRGFRVEQVAAPAKIQKQFKLASRRAIPYVWVESYKEPGVFEVKNMETGEQTAADPATWTPT